MKDTLSSSYQFLSSNNIMEQNFLQSPNNKKQQKSSSNGASSSSSGSAVFGRFLKLGKSKSDVQLFGRSNNKSSKGKITSIYNSELEDDFVLAPVSINSSDKMVHNYRQNHGSISKRDNVSRSHSWIYGSMKLPSNSQDLDNHSNSGIGKHRVVNEYSSSPVHHVPHHQQSQQQRCHISSEFYCNCSCDCSGNGGGNGQTGLGYSEPMRKSSNHGGSAMSSYGIITPIPPETNNNNKLMNSVRKLTWKSLKQAVKKRPSILESISTTTKSTPTRPGEINLQLQPSLFNHPNYISGAYCSSSYDDLVSCPSVSNQPNYFFPEKKTMNYYSSCTELYPAEGSMSVAPPTASVRLRPKRSRPTWSFPNEFGPMPSMTVESNEHGSDADMYHSEWDLRKCVVPYEEWISTNSSELAGSPIEEPKTVKITTKPSHVSPATPSPISTTPTPDKYSNGGLMRFSILHSESPSAYQLNHTEEDEELSGDEGHNGHSDEETSNGNPGVDQQVRIAGQGINVTYGTTTVVHSSNVARTNSFNKSKTNTNGNHPHHLIATPTINTPNAISDADGEWSDTETVESARDSKAKSKSVKSKPAPAVPNTTTVVKVNTPDVCSTFKQQVKPKSVLKTPSTSPTNGIYVKQQSSKDVKSSHRSIIKSSSDNTKNSQSGGGKYGALKRRSKGRRSGSSNNLLRETIYEEESEEVEGENSDSNYSVKIVVNGSSSPSTNANAISTDYVKPILKMSSRSNNDEDISSGHDNEVIINSNKNNSRSPKKVKFNNYALEEVVGGCNSTSEIIEEAEEEEGEEAETETEEEIVVIDTKTGITTTNNVQQLNEIGEAAEVEENERKEIIPITKEVPKNTLNHIQNNEVKDLDFEREVEGEIESKKSLSRNDRKMEMMMMMTSGGPTPKVNRNSPTSIIKNQQEQQINKILNPNSLLFNDTTRIRLNQARPSLDSIDFKTNNNGHSKNGTIFDQNGHQKLPQQTASRGTNSSSRRAVRPSASFRNNSTSSSSISMGSIAAAAAAVAASFRPKEPPPPPPRQGLVPPPLPRRLNGPKNKGTTKADISNPIPISTTNGALSTHYHNSSILFNKSHPSNVKPNASPKIEILSKENSVSEIRIYSGGLKTNNENSSITTEKKSNANNSHYASTDILNERPQSTSVVLIINNNNDSDDNTTKTSQEPVDPINLGSNLIENDKANANVDVEEPLYDDVNHESAEPILSLIPPALPPPNSNSNSPRRPLSLASNSSNSNGENDYNLSVYSDVGFANMTVSINNSERAQEESFYDDTICSGSGPPPIPPIQEEDEIDEPLYDDVMNILSESQQDSDSGTEPDLPPPPLPSTGPPIHLLPKISMDLPLIPLPILPSLEPSNSTTMKKASSTTNLLANSISRGTSKLFSGITKRLSLGSISNDEIHLPSVIPEESPAAPKLQSQLQLPLGQNLSQSDPNLLDSQSTRSLSLLHELNEKLAHLNLQSNANSSSSHSPTSSSSPEDYSTYISKVQINSTGSDSSSGVEEDYNSEKNYSLSSTGSITTNGTGNASMNLDDTHYRLNKLVNETMQMARGKFLDSMKIRNNSVDSEPIYEEINDSDSSNPIYSDTFSNSTSTNGGNNSNNSNNNKWFLDGASRNEILSVLESIRDQLNHSNGVVAKGSGSNGGQGQLDQTVLQQQQQQKLNMTRNLSSTSTNRKSIEIERNDSGIGSESGSLITLKSGFRLCQDCNTHSVEPPEDENSSSATDNYINQPPPCPTVCRSCHRKRNERKEIITEIYETELKYGRDLRIILDEFYSPIQRAGLLTKEQLDGIFLNVSSLVRINEELSSLFKDAIDEVDRKHLDLNGVNVGKIFLDIGEKMMSVFENYCLRQASAGALLTQLEKEKELLRIFLRVSQMENIALRRMNLPAFLMVPVQRVTRYPLLLCRLLKVTPQKHSSRDELQLAQEKIEQSLEAMNKTSKDFTSSVKLWRRSSSTESNLNNSSPIHRRSSSEPEGSASVRMKKVKRFFRQSSKDSFL